MSSEFLASSWKHFHGCSTLRVRTQNYVVLFHRYKFRGSPLNHENYENFTPPKIPAIRYVHDEKAQEYFREV